MANDTKRIRTALLSVSDKTGIATLGRALARHGIKMYSTGGTKGALEAAGLDVIDVATLTGQAEAFGGRMKTLSFPVASGILFDRDRDRAEAEALGITPIDLVVVNLYPFAEHKEKGHALGELIEWIDIGGPTMIRAAAKNFAHVAVLTAPADYDALIAELDEHGGATRLTSRQRWMQTAFAATADYDAMIAAHLADRSGELAPSLQFGPPERLRYGENPHQRATFAPAKNGIVLEMLGGKELSYNNLVDLDAALDAVLPLPDPACAIIKHENPCGLASGPSTEALLERAWAGDDVSAFGSVIAFNRPLTKRALEFLALDDKEHRRFVEIVAAPAFDDAARAYLASSKNLRALRIDDRRSGSRKQHRVLATGLLVQDADVVAFDKLDVVSEAKPSFIDEPLLRFGIHAVRCLKSNAIALVRREAQTLTLLGMGAGQPNRVRSTELALAQAKRNLTAEARAKGERDIDASVRRNLGSAYLISDAFFPFADGPELALEAGVRFLVEPGGSIRDADVIAGANRHGAHLVFTGTRHFKH